MGRTGLALGSDARPNDAVPVMLLDKRGTAVQPLAVGRVKTAAPGRCGHSVCVESLLAGEGPVTGTAMPCLASVLDP